MEKKSLFKTIPVARPWFSEDEEEEVLQALRSGWVAQGPRVREFEQVVAEYVGAAHGVALSSCTSALQVGLEVLGVGLGDEVILPSFTFVASANSVVSRGAKPVFVDIDPKTYNINPALIEKAVTPRTKVIMAVDQVGLPADLDPIFEMAKKKGLRVLEDAACALGSEYKGRKIGGFGEISCFSFHPRKLITTGEGGMITTSDNLLAESARGRVSHGVSVPALKRHESNKIVTEEYQGFGYNYRMSDLQAAVGLAQFRKLDEILARKRRLAQRYNEAFSQMPEFEPPYEPSYAKTNFQSYLLRILPRAGKSRDEIMQELLDLGISTRRGIMAIHLESSYRNRFGVFHLPETERAAKESMVLPLYPQMTEEEQDQVIESVKKVLSA